MGKNAHYQTISSNLLGQLPGFDPHKRGLVSEDEIIPTQDGTGDRLYIHVHRYTGPSGHDIPAVVLVHGLEGSASSIYMVKMTKKLLHAGFHVVRMNMRGCGPGVDLARNLYNSGFTLDVETVLAYVREKLSSKIALVGFSLGANVTLKYMGEDREERNRQRALMGAPPIRGKLRDRIADVFIAVSPPLDLHASCEVLDGPAARIYRDMFLREIRKRVLPQRKFDHIPNAHAELAHVRDWFEFDNIYIAPSAGFIGALEYHRHCASRYYVPHIETPGLVLHAHDDPLIDPIGWDETNWKAKPHLTAHLTRYGGHLGWLSRKHAFIPDRRWMDYRLMHYLTEWRDGTRIKKGRKSFWMRLFGRT